MTDAVSSVRAETRATKVSYVLGKHQWTVMNDVFSCSKGQPYTTLLKMSGCNQTGEFTCNDGQCVTMEQRCDQIPDCRDKSDERGCQLVIVEEGYNKEVPPFMVNSIEQAIVPAIVNISIDLIKVIDMEEENHKIDLQFQITLEWRENSRVIFHNLKQDKSLNALSTQDVNTLWHPLVIYDNTDQKEVTRLGLDWEWTSPTIVIREGDYTNCENNPSCKRSSDEEVDETEIFEAEKNRIEMQQVYTWQFQCTYDLKFYPFDAQVRGEERGNALCFLPPGVYNRDDNGRQGPGDGDAAAPQDDHEAEPQQ